MYTRPDGVGRLVSYRNVIRIVFYFQPTVATQKLVEFALRKRATSTFSPMSNRQPR